MQDAELRELIEFAGTLADAAGAAILPYFREPQAVENKRPGGYDPVTIADRAAEQAIRMRINSAYPDHGIVGEEFPTTRSRSGLSWYIDPIDGTRAFITGTPVWGTLIALNKDGEPLLGIIDQPFTSERFIGSRLGGEMRSRGKSTPLKTRACARLADAVLTTTHPNAFARPSEHAAFLAIGKQCRMYRYGGDCYAYAMLAHGLIDLVIETGLQPYDVQALIPVITAAGGKITNWSGGSAAQGGQVIAAGDVRLHAHVMELLKSEAD